MGLSLLVWVWQNLWQASICMRYNTIEFLLVPECLVFSFLIYNYKFPPSYSRHLPTSILNTLIISIFVFCISFLLEETKNIDINFSALPSVPYNYIISTGRDKYQFSFILTLKFGNCCKHFQLLCFCNDYFFVPGCKV